MVLVRSDRSSLPSERLESDVPGFQQEISHLHYSVGVMAYNEEANIQQTLAALLAQKSVHTSLSEVIVVASGCTDQTVPLVQQMMLHDSRLHLLVQARREGKASAINLFLQHARSNLLVLVGADIIPAPDTLEKLCLHFTDPTIGMIGAHPMPINDQQTFMGHAVHMLWTLHDRLARRQPKLGEVVAFRNVIARIPSDTAVDEMAIQTMLEQQAFRLVYEPAALVYNKGPMTVKDFLTQRRRINAGHMRLGVQKTSQAPTMQMMPILREVVACAPTLLASPRQLVWTMGAIALEGIARAMGRYDVWCGRTHHIWQMAPSTKVLAQAPLERQASAPLCWFQDAKSPSRAESSAEECELLS